MNEDLISFIEEANENIESLETFTLSYENGDAYDVDEAFRALHTLKGNAGFFNFENIKNLSHAVEDILDLIKQDQLTLSSEIFELILKAHDDLRAMLDDIGEEPHFKVSELIEQLRNYTSSKTAHSSSNASLNDTDNSQASEEPRIDSGKFKILVTCGPEVNSAEIQQLLRSVGEIKETNDPQKFTCLSVLEIDMIETLVTGLDVTLEYFKEPKEPVTSEITEDTHPTQSPDQPKASSPAKAPNTASTPNTPAAKATTIKIGLNQIQKILSLAGELILSRNQFQESIDPETRRAFASISQQVTMMQEEVIKLSMDPASKITQNFPRIVRDLSNKLGKKVKLVVTGQDVLFEARMIDLLKAPFTHIIRNAMDHGIEKPEDRIAQGKMLSGTLSIHFKNLEEDVLVEIKDDGKGIDPEMIKASALKKGLITEDESHELSYHDTLQLIMAAGFSTAETLTDVSGRGVGMDVVRTEIESLGGHVEIASAVGVGTTFTLSIPKSINIIRSLIVEVGETVYAIPETAVLEVLKLNPSTDDRLVIIEETEVIKHRDEFLPILYLDQVIRQTKYVDVEGKSIPDRRKRFVDRRKTLHTEEPESPVQHLRTQPDRRHEDPIRPVAIMDDGNRKFALVFDQIMRREETVVKELAPCLQTFKFFMGATILSTGRTCMILNHRVIGDEIRDNFEPRKINTQVDDYIEESYESYLVFSVGPHKFGVYTEQIHAIETYDTQYIQDIGDRKVYMNDPNHWEIYQLADKYPIPPISNPGFLLSLATDKGKSICISKFEGVKEYSTQVKKMDSHEEVSIASLVIDDELITILDHELLFQTSKLKTNSMKDFTQWKILFVDDDPIFHKLLNNVAKQFNLNVVHARNGKEALHILEDQRDINLVFTDLQMPGMSGYELVETIRNTSHVMNLPVVAMTAPRKEEKISVILEYGFNSFMTKFSRDKLLKALQEVAEVVQI